jgi:uncharacterized protein YbjT (DUF2867 family)
MARTALLVGATGLVGDRVLERLLADPRWSRVVVLARRPTRRQDPKLDEQLVDFDRLPPLAGLDDVFACLGTTIKVAGTQERFRDIDHGYTLAVAKLGFDAGARRVALVSSVGASEGARSFYLRVKGETERDVRAIGFASCVIARPSLLLGPRAETRYGERVGAVVAGLVAPLLQGGLRPYRAIEAGDVAAALVASVAEGEAGERVLTYDALRARALE